MSDWFDTWKEHLLSSGGMDKALKDLGVDAQKAEEIAMQRSREKALGDRNRQIQLAWGYVNGIGIGAKQAGGPPEDLEAALRALLGELKEKGLKKTSANRGASLEQISEAAARCAMESRPALQAVSLEEMMEMAAEGMLLGIYAGVRIAPQRSTKGGY